MCLACGHMRSSSLYHATASWESAGYTVPSGSPAPATIASWESAGDTAPSGSPLPATTTALYTAVLSSWSWVGPSTLTPSAQPAFVTYSFPTAMAAHARAEFGAAADTWSPFTEVEKHVARLALKQWADASGLTFLEVSGDRGDILFNWLDFDQAAGHGSAWGFAYYPIGHHPTRANDVSIYAPWSGDVYLNRADRDGDLADRSTLTHLILHELGHALGLKHPFQSAEANPQVLRADLDRASWTVMSYTGESPILGVFDKQAVAALYGAPGSDGAHLSSWSWTASSETLRQAGSAGPDAIRGTSVTDRIAGGAGDDRLYGFAAADWLRSGAGRDVLSGGTGRDTFVFDTALNPRTNVDTITDFWAPDDTIRLDDAVFKALTRTGPLAEKAFHQGTAAHDRDDRIIYDPRSGALLYDPDGNRPGGAAAIKFAILKSTGGLGAADFIVV